MGGGGFVEQGYASLMTGCGACVADCWMSRLVVVGPPWRVSLDNPSCRTYYREPASNGNSSTIAIAREQCQTQIPRMLQAGFNRIRGNACADILGTGELRRADLLKVAMPVAALTERGQRLSMWRQVPRFDSASANLPCYGLPMDSVEVCLRFCHGKSGGCVFCEAPKAKDDAKTDIVYRGEHCFVILNAYPYTPGHVMIVPYAHLDELRKLPADAAHEMMACRNGWSPYCEGSTVPTASTWG